MELPPSLKDVPVGDVLDEMLGVCERDELLQHAVAKARFHLIVAEGGDRTLVPRGPLKDVCKFAILAAAVPDEVDELLGPFLEYLLLQGELLWL